MSMKMSFSAYKLVNTPFEWAYNLEGMGFQGWEIVSEGKQKLTSESLPPIRDIINSTGLEISVHGPFSDLNCASLNDAIWNETIKQIDQCVELCADFSDVVVVHPGILSPLGNQLPDKAWERNVEALRAVCDHAKDYRVTICLENMINMEKLLCRTPSEIFGMVEAVDRENIGMTFDIGHSNTMRNVPDFLKEKAKFTHVHVHDNHGVKDEHLEVGTGTVDWDRALSALRDYKGIAVVEARSLEEGGRSLKFIKEWEQNH
jgi:sugar phosphate isomerase/epimerase